MHLSVWKNLVSSSTLSASTATGFASPLLHSIHYSIYGFSCDYYSTFEIFMADSISEAIAPDLILPDSPLQSPPPLH